MEKNDSEEKIRIPIEIAIDMLEKKLVRVIKESRLPATVISLELEKLKNIVDEDAERKLQKLYEGMRTTVSDKEEGDKENAEFREGYETNRN